MLALLQVMLEEFIPAGFKQIFVSGLLNLDYSKRRI